MELLQMSGWVVLALVLVLGFFWLYRKDRPQSLTDLAAQVLEAERLAHIGVRAAEQIYAPDEGEVKFAYADEFLHELFPNLDATQRKIAIESAVLVLHKAREYGILPALPVVGTLTTLSEE